MFTINGEAWQILLVSPYHPALQRSDGSWALGMCYDDNKTIYIDIDLLDESKRFKKVLCHEITHAAMFSYDVELAYEQEEVLADILATYGEEIVDITNKIFSRLHSII